MRGPRWQIDENWVARRCRDDFVLEEVQLSAERASGLSRGDWETRFSRREHQIRIGKATDEYKALIQAREERAAAVGSDGVAPEVPEEPKTPTVVVQNTKSAFEEEYREWRVQLHRWHR